MVEKYTSFPKKRRVYIKEDGNLAPLGKRSGDSTLLTYTASGTLLADGHLTVSGSQFKADSIVVANYFSTVSGTSSLVVSPADGTVTFKGDNNTGFFYVVFNQPV